MLFLSVIVATILIALMIFGKTGAAWIGYLVLALVNGASLYWHYKIRPKDDWTGMEGIGLFVSGGFMVGLGLILLIIFTVKESAR